MLNGNYLWTLSVSFLDIFGRFWTEIKIFNFSGKNAETYISEIKTQA